MLTDMLSTDMYVSYNVKLAHRIGLHAAIYITELLNISRKAFLKNKIVDNKYFKVDRRYVEQRTTLTEKEQREIDIVLQGLSVITFENSSKDILFLDVDTLTGLLLDDRESVEKQLKPIVKRKKSSKRDEIIKNLMNRITTTNAELRVAYEGWINGVLDRQGWLSAAAVVEAQKVVDEYTGKDLDLALELINEGAANGYRDMTWAINRLENKKKQRISRNIPDPVDSLAEKRVKIDFSDEVY